MVETDSKPQTRDFLRPNGGFAKVLEGFHQEEGALAKLGFSGQARDAQQPKVKIPMT